MELKLPVQSHFRTQCLYVLGVWWISSVPVLLVLPWFVAAPLLALLLIGSFGVLVWLAVLDWRSEYARRSPPLDSATESALELAAPGLRGHAGQ